MSKITQYVRHLAVVAIASLLAQCAWADRVIAIDFNAGQGRGNAGNAANKLANDTAITIGSYTINGQYWNQYQCAASANHTEGVTVYDTEAGTTETMSMIVKTTAGGNYTVNDAAEQNVTNGYMDDGSGVKVELTTAPFDKYDIILVQATDTASRKFAPSLVNGVLYKADANGNAVLAAHKTDNWGASRTTDVTLGTNAMRVNNLCGPLTIYGGRNLSNAQRGGIAALVVIERTTPATQVYIANEDCTASNTGGVGNYKPTKMTIPTSAITPEGAKLWIDAVTFCLEGTSAAKAGSITLAGTQSGSPTVAGEWNVTSLDGSSSMGPRITFPFATAAKVTVGTEAAMSAPADSRFRLYKTTDAKWGAIQLNNSMGEWRPAYQISARVPGVATINGTVETWAGLTWEEKNPFAPGAPVELTVAGESTLTLGAAVSCAELVITGSADLTITDPQNLTYTKLDLSGFTGNLIIDYTTSTVVTDHVGDNTTDFLMGNVVGGTIVLKGSSIVGLTTVGGNSVALDGTTIRIEGGLVKVNSKDQGGSLKNVTVELAGGRIYNYGWFQASGTLTLDAGTDIESAAFCKYCSGTPVIVKKGAGKVSFEAGDTSGNYTSIKAEAGTLSFSGNPVTATALIAGEGTIEIPNGKTLTVGSLSGTGDVNVTGSGTLKVQNDSDFAGTLNLSGSVTLDLGTMRPSFAIATADTATVKIQVGATDDGSVTLNGTIGNVTVVDGGNTTLEATKTTEGSTTVVTFPITVSGKACWIAYEFNGNLNSTGTDTTSLSRDQDDRQYRYGDDATSDFRPVSNGEGYDALYAGSHPWRNITYKDSFTCAMYGTLPQADEAGLLVFGSTTSAPQGLIGLMTGSVENNTVLLVRSSGSQNNATKYETMAEMSVPNPFTTPHLYIFSKTGRTIKVYLDGILWTTYESTTDFTIGGGFQICSVHGGSYTTGVNRFAPPSRDAAQNQAIYKECVIDSLRLYDGVLGEKAIAALKTEFPYVSPNGSYSRSVADASTWSETDAWTKAGDNTASELPAVGSALTLSATTATSVITVGLDSTTTYEAITFGGSEGSTITVKKGTGLVANAGQTVVSVPVTIEEGAMTISGGPTVITGAGSLSFDYSALDVNSYKTDAFIQLTGMMDVAADKVSCTLPEASTYSDRTVTFGYDTASKTYRITITMNDITLTIPSFDNATVAVTVNGATVAVSNNQITAKAGSTVVVTYTAVTGYHLTAETTSETIENLASDSAVSFTEMPAAVNVYTVAVTKVENTVVSVKIGDADPVVCTEDTVEVEHGKAFVATYTAAVGYKITSGTIEYTYSTVTQNFTEPYSTNIVVEEMTALEKLVAAIDAAEAGATVTATGDIELGNNEYIGKAVTIDLGSNTMTVTADASGIMFGATITNGSIVKNGTGSIQFTPGTTATITLNVGSVSVVGGTLTVVSGNEEKVVAEATYGQMKYYSLTDPAPAEITFTLGIAPENAIRVVTINGVESDVAGNALVTHVGDSIVVTYKPANGFIGKTVTIQFAVANSMQTTEIQSPTAEQMNIRPVVAVAAVGEPSLTPETQGFGTLAEAIAAGWYVFLTDAVTVDSTIVIDHSVVIDLQGHNITGNGVRVFQVKNGTVEIDSTDADSGDVIPATISTIGSINPDSSVIRIGSEDASAAPELTIDEGVTVASAVCYGITAFGPGTQTLVVDGTVATTGNRPAISGNGNASNGETTITINGTVSATAENAIYQPQAGTTTINGTVTGGIEAKAGAVTIKTGATVSARETTATHTANGDGCSTQGYAVAVVDNAGYKGGAVVTIEGGTITGPVAKIVDSTPKAANTFTITGGTFTAPVAEEYCGTGLIPTNNGNGTYGVKEGAFVARVNGVGYETLQAALGAVTEETTVTLIANASSSERIVYTGAPAITLDLNGKEISSTADVALVNKGGTMTITGEGTIDASKATDSDNDCVWAHSGNIIIKNGTFINKSTTSATVYLTNSAVVTIEGGAFKNLEPTFVYGTTTETHYFGVLNVNNKSSVSQLVVKGGSFLGTDPAKGDDNLGGSFLASGYESVYNAETKTYTVSEKTGPTSWEDIKENDDVTTIITLPEGQAKTAITATELKAWAEKTGATFGDAIPVNALIFNTTPAAVQAESFVAEEAASTVLEEVIEAEELDLAALLAKAAEKGADGLTITSLSTKYPMATIKLVPSTKLESTGTAKFFQLSIELK